MNKCQRSLIRTFHPVGQGAFYTEKLKFGNGQCFNMVYDCGCRGNRSYARSIVERTFNDDDKIDLLFISHFDFDHVSLIKELKPFKNNNVMTVVLPLLYSNLKLALVGFYLSTYDRRSGLDIGRQVELIMYPERYFKGCQVLYVLPDDNNSSFEDLNHSPVNDEDEKLFGNLGASAMLQVGSCSNISDSEGWSYVPFNYDCKNRYRKLMQELRKWLKCRNARFKNLGDIRFVNKHRSALKHIYKSLSGGINENSMALYSGPDGDHQKVEIKCQPSGIPCDKPGCIYTGDADINEFDLSQVYRKYIDKVGVVQVPHHGSSASFCPSHFPAAGRVCPVSYGTRNSYGHPGRNVEVQISAVNGDFVRAVTGSGPVRTVGPYSTRRVGVRGGSF